MYFKDLVEEAEAGFHVMDTNNDGELDKAELEAGIQLIRAKLEGQMRQKRNRRICNQIQRRHDES